MSQDLHDLGESLISTAARVVRWAPKGESDLSLSAARILARLSDKGSQRISDLAAAEKSSQPTITNHVKRLESAGLVGRTADPTDARAWMIDLTPRGHQRLAELRSTMGTNVEPYIAQLDEDERAALARGLAVMRRLMTLPAPENDQAR
ncbi:MarR family winged helix-turn-helix transcriptional regulator [Microlunatus ginsengisoli]|uniref:HTH marR-type domain-containing protein n=1 Tax=Microlunatus ginsengisoli TaxID=363863 RepID=A0ABP6ZIT1_9ACTN